MSVNTQAWGQMVDVLKDIQAYLLKQDAEQTRATLDKPPKISEDQADEPLKGGEAPGFGPGKGVAKSISVEVPDNAKRTEQNNVDSEGGSMLKAEGEYMEGEEELEDDEELEDENGDEEYYEEEDVPQEDVEELKSLLKDIKSTMIAKSAPVANNVGTQLTKEIVSEIKKSLPLLVQSETTKMMRKMGFTPTRPDVVKLGLDELPNDRVDIKKSDDERLNEIYNIVDKQSKKSWNELGRERENLGQFRAFGQ